MKKNTTFALATTAVIALGAYAATERLWFENNTISLGLDVENLDSISIKDGQLNVATINNGNFAFDLANVNKATATANDETTEVLINYDGDVATVVNPYAFTGVDITVDGADVTVNAAVAEASREVVYHLSGTTTTGSFKIYSDYKLEVLLDNASITNDNGSAINIQTGKKTTLRVPDKTVSTLCDSKKYNTPDGEDEKATLFSEGQIEFRGKGTLNITGTKKHAICSDDYVELKNTTINILSAASDGIHANDYVSILSGNLTMTNLSGDGIDADDEGYINIEGGNLDITVSGDSNKGIKASGGAINISNGSIALTMSGNSVIKNNDPSYCSGIKAGTDFNMSGGAVTIRSTGTAGKGISVDGNATITGGDIDIEVAGAGGTYTTTSSTTDSYSATCLTVDGNANILAGNLTLNTTSAASGGKCIKVDGALTFGDTDNIPVVTATTRGSRFQVTSSTSNGGWNGGGGNRPGGNFGGGGNNNTDYCNPKVIKAVGNLTVNNGIFTITCTSSGDGGEGLESKDTLTINGGELTISTYDDCINASNQITITGGKIYCHASGNDAIDSNGKITISGGEIIALGASQPEAGIDCDYNSNFTLTGGIIVSLAGSNNTPGTSATTQRVVYTTGSFNTSTTYTLLDSNGNFVLSFRPPVSYSSNSNLMFSSPVMTAKNKSFKLYTGGTVTGGETFNGLTTDATYTAGTLKSTLTTK